MKKWKAPQRRSVSGREGDRPCERLGMPVCQRRRYECLNHAQEKERKAKAQRVTEH